MFTLYHFRLTLFNNARFDALTTMTTKSTVSWDMTPCSDVEIHTFSQACNVSIFSTYSTPKMKATRYAQKSIHSYQTRRLHIPTTREIRYSKCSSFIRKYPSVLHLYTILSFQCNDLHAFPRPSSK
jgi:3D (Asp-Asp-Asp) domain-containing protein